MMEVMKQISLEADWVLMDLEATNDESALQQLAQRLVEKGVVKESYIEAVIERERMYATGLQCDGIGVAIPHTDSEHVMIQGMGIARLEKPIAFKQMGFPEMEVPVQLIFMLAINEPKQQVKFLQALMTLFEDSSKLKRLMECKDSEALTLMFTGFFENRKGEKQ